MNWKLQLGIMACSMERALLRMNTGFVKNNYPYGRNWMFDVKRIIKEPHVIIDAGANVGSVSLELNHWFPDADIYAFEPVKKTFDILAGNTVAKSKIHPVCSGLGDNEATVAMLIGTENTINSLKVTEKHANIIGTEQINIVRLDAFAHQQAITAIGILKIDVEGFEFEVLRGCKDLLETGIQCIYLEVGYEREPTKVHFSDVESFMETKGFELCGIYETRRNMFNKHRLWYSNNLYIKKELLT